MRCYRKCIKMFKKSQTSHKMTKSRNLDHKGLKKCK